MASTVTRSQLSIFGMFEQEIRIIDVQQLHDVDQNLWGMFQVPHWIYALKN